MPLSSTTNQQIKRIILQFLGNAPFCALSEFLESLSETAKKENASVKKNRLFPFYMSFCTNMDEAIKSIEEYASYFSYYSGIERQRQKYKKDNGGKEANLIARLLEEGEARRRSFLKKAAPHFIVFWGAPAICRAFVSASLSMHNPSPAEEEESAASTGGTAPAGTPRTAGNDGKSPSAKRGSKTH